MPIAAVPDTHCEECSHPVPAACLVTVVEGDRLCPDCAGDTICAGCATPTRHASPTVDSNSRCSNCLIGWDRCRRCDLFTSNALVLVERTTEVAVCRTCAPDYERCVDCNVRAVHTTDTDRGEVCSDCLRSYDECMDCEQLVPIEVDRCAACTCHDDERIHFYNYHPTPIFHGEGSLFLGMELELITPRKYFSDAVDLAIDHLDGLGYLKRDGSIRPIGFEMVTHPMSWDYARASFPWQLLTKLHLLDCRTDSSVGIHIHVSRSGFTSPAHILRWMKLFYRNESQVCTLARRRSDQWAKFSPAAREAAAEYAKGSTRGDRYHAINVRPEHTFELRIFQSSLRQRQVKAALAFAAASVEYTRTLTAAQVVRHHGWEWPVFCAWLASRPEYSDLHTELQELECAC
ncbi:hypothetical protein [Nocardia sp. CNY236]|uniref:hypothetical protein n=1 Tax=Nocardia sp. CNY236 TaxID=1169152 RepID=UPI000490C6DD|nr:hypothetical protein [Nocardia sp. CNY236]